MLNTTTLLNAFGRDFPKRLAKTYGDYVGLMCGRLPKTLKKIALVLDMEPCLLEAMIAAKPDLILTHHPLIYGPKTTVLKRDEGKRHLVKALEKHRLPVYSLHTNFDAGRGGMNDALAARLGLLDVTPWQGDVLARGGRLAQPMTREAFAAFVKKTFNLPYVFLIPEGKPRIERVGIIGGGGAKYFAMAQAEGYDIFLSGDSAHHHRRGVVNAHYNYLEIPHEVETIFIPTMAAYLKTLDPTLTLITHLTQALPQLF
jgi:dinuclear metal center YbgI/SA1388 family protein